MATATRADEGLRNPADRKAIWGWALYDFGNSAFTTLIVTFIYSFYFAQEIAPDGNTGTVIWANGIALTAVVVALSSPFLGALADRGGHRRPERGAPRPRQHAHARAMAQPGQPS